MCRFFFGWCTVTLTSLHMRMVGRLIGKDPSCQKTCSWVRSQRTQDTHGRCQIISQTVIWVLPKAFPFCQDVEGLEPFTSIWLSVMVVDRNHLITFLLLHVPLWARQWKQSGLTRPNRTMDVSTEQFWSKASLIMCSMWNGTRMSRRHSPIRMSGKAVLPMCDDDLALIFASNWALCEQSMNLGLQDILWLT